MAISADIFHLPAWISGSDVGMPFSGLRVSRGLAFSLVSVVLATLPQASPTGAQGKWFGGWPSAHSMSPWEIPAALEQVFVTMFPSHSYHPQNRWCGE